LLRALKAGATHACEGEGHRREGGEEGQANGCAVAEVLNDCLLVRGGGGCCAWLRDALNRGEKFRRGRGRGGVTDVTGGVVLRPKAEASALRKLLCADEVFKIPWGGGRGGELLGGGAWGGLLLRAAVRWCRRFHLCHSCGNDGNGEVDIARVDGHKLAGNGGHLLIDTERDRLANDELAKELTGFPSPRLKI
jgi:hypothetical protein